MLDLATSLALLQTECGMHRDMIIACICVHGAVLRVSDLNNRPRVYMREGLDIPPQEYCKQLNFGLVEVVFEWARGMVRACASE